MEGGVGDWPEVGPAVDGGAVEGRFPGLGGEHGEGREVDEGAEALG